jgi:hypothetical protein
MVNEFAGGWQMRAVIDRLDSIGSTTVLVLVGFV